MARKNHFVGALAVAAGILAAVGMLVLMTLVVKVGPARAQEGPNFAFSLAYAGTRSGPGESHDIQVLLNYECPVGSGSFIALCSDVGPPLVPSSGVRVSRVPRPTALCLRASVVGLAQLH